MALEFLRCWDAIIDLAEIDEDENDDEEGLEDERDTDKLDDRAFAAVAVSVLDVFTAVSSSELSSGFEGQQALFCKSHSLPTASLSSFPFHSLQSTRS